MTRFVYVLPAGRFRWEVRVDTDTLIEAAAERIGHDDDCGPERTPSGNCWCGSVGTARAAVDAIFAYTVQRIIYTRKAHALIAARAIAIVIGGEVQPHDRRGRIQDPDSFGPDPERSVG